ncbi:hypothetical protein QR680_011430 [Steinernema hermaphroditum]|uniref:Uncharacterized protein n=1 Tax=Steinernema hermaphroditum TaxID=289476 RepID=A0AA39LYY7_9BILA|nr:hypothetical protein QR680_011430 [Steinernema hermaphroditum]
MGVKFSHLWRSSFDVSTPTGCHLNLEMDTVPYDFVVRLMRLRLATFRRTGRKSTEKLGRNYGTIATEIASKDVDCEISVPGLFSDEPLSSDQKFACSPVFEGVVSGKNVNFDSIAEAQDILCFSVTVEEVQEFDDGITHDRFLKLMQLCRYARFRHLIIRCFPPQERNFQLGTIPNARSFFNCVTLIYQVDSPLFRDVLIAFSRTQKLELLKILDNDANDYFLEPARTFSRPSESPPPEWLHDVLLKMFYQSQLVDLQLHFSPSWMATIFCDIAVTRWIQSPETFPKTLMRSASGLGAPPLILFHKYDFSTISRGSAEADLAPYMQRTFHLPHPSERGWRLVMHVFTKNERMEQEDISDTEFCALASCYVIDFCFQDGEAASFWRHKRGTPITNGLVPCRSTSRKLFCAVVSVLLICFFIPPLR